MKRSKTNRKNVMGVAENSIMISHKAKKKLLNSNHINLCDLPPEILEKIITEINIWQHNRIRASCKCLKTVCDGVLMHDFKVSIKKYKLENPTGYEYAALQAIYQANWAYIEAGYCPLFLGTMLHLLRNDYRNPFSPAIGRIRKFLLKFYCLVDECLEDPFSQTSRLLYTITLLGFLYKCKNAVLLTSEVLDEQWRFVYQLKGS